MFKKIFFREYYYLSILIFPLIFSRLEKWGTTLICSSLTIIIFACEFFREKNNNFSTLFDKIFKIKKENKLDDQAWIMLAISLILLLFHPSISIASICIFPISTIISKIVANFINSKKFFEKTLSESIAFYLSGILVLFICGIFYEVNLWFYFFGFVAIFCSTIIAARPNIIDLNNNFMILLSFPTVMFIFDMMWQYIPNKI